MSSSYLNYLRIGRTTLWHGAPLRAAVRVDAPTGERAPARFPSVALQIQPEEGEPLLAESFGEEGYVLFEVNTDELAPGAYGLTFLIHPNSERLSGEIEEVVVPEEVWLLERSDYEKYLDEELNEEFRESTTLDPYHAARLVREMVVERYDELALWRDYELTFQPDPEARYWGGPMGLTSTITPGDAIFPAATIRWTTDRMLGLLQELALGRIRQGGLWFGVNGREEAVTFRLKGELIEPLSQEAVWSLKDEEFGELTLLPTFWQESRVDYAVHGGHSSFEVNLELPVAATR